MVGFVAEDLAEVFAEGELVEGVGLLDAAAVVADGLFLVFEIETQHVGRFFAGLYCLGGDGWLAAEEIDPVAELESVRELFLGVDFELTGDVHVGRALEYLRVVHVGDDRLELALQIFVEEVDQFLLGDRGGRGRFGRNFFRHNVPFAPWRHEVRCDAGAKCRLGRRCRKGHRGLAALHRT